AKTSSLMIDGDALKQIPLDKSGVNTPQYQLVYRQLKRIKEANPAIKFIYTMAKTDRPGVLQFIVDLNPVMKTSRRNTLTAFPGDRYYAFRFPDMLKGFFGASADEKLMVDEWGTTLSAYAPIRDQGGNAVAIIGIDMAAGDVYALQKQVHWRAFLVMIIGFIISIGLGLLLSSRITERIEKLVEGTRRISEDDLNYNVKVEGHDEISELAESFNNMARNLSESKKRLQDYFFRVVQSLVRILEAKDEYTRGHSERVADYAKTIALGMGFSEVKAEVLKKAAQLHDIGKLVIHEEILNKKGALTEEEWKIIKEHPLLGEEVLKPVFPDEDMLAMVRSHHERYDGNGYPDNI
ncbi:MAG: HD domain-containing protein, partial [Candidatus Omnitrophica bacterium]|nr:HD domain-containing protein [Candidatus Omnitrophota bacterium]